MNPRLHLRKCIYGLVLFATFVYLIPVIIEFYVRWRLTDEGSKNEIELHSTHNTNNRTVVEENLLTCPVPPPFLRGHLEVVDVNLTSLNLTLSIYYGGEVERGGIWRPKDCDPRKKVAVMIPFRNRWEQLNTFLNHMHPVFQRQQLDYRIFVIEQVNFFDICIFSYIYIYKEYSLRPSSKSSLFLDLFLPHDSTKISFIVP